MAQLYVLLNSTGHQLFSIRHKVIGWMNLVWPSHVLLFFSVLSPKELFTSLGLRRCLLLLSPLLRVGLLISSSNASSNILVTRSKWPAEASWNKRTWKQTSGSLLPHWNNLRRVHSHSLHCQCCDSLSFHSKEIYPAPAPTTSVIQITPKIVFASLCWSIWQSVPKSSNDDPPFCVLEIMPDHIMKGN